MVNTKKKRMQIWRYKLLTLRMVVRKKRWRSGLAVGAEKKHHLAEDSTC